MKKIFSFILVISLVFGMNIGSVYGVTVPNIYKDSVNVRVGSAVTVDFTYGDSATTAEVVTSSLGIDATLSGRSIIIKGVSEGIAYVTLLFNDSTTDSIRVDVGNKSGGNIKDNTLEVEKNRSSTMYIDLEEYGANRATITYDSDYISLSKSTFTSSGTLTVTGRKYGNSDIRISYNSGEVVYISVDVVTEGGGSSHVTHDITLNIDDVSTFYVDLRSYNASSATISTDSTCVSLSKTYIGSSQYVEVTGCRRGTSEIKVRYSTGDYEYYTVYVESNSTQTGQNPSVSVNSLSVEKGDTTSFSVFLGNCNRATIHYNSTNVGVSTSTIYSDTRLSVTGRSISMSDITINYSDGTSITIPTEVTNKKYVEPTAVLSRLRIEPKKESVLSLYMGTDSSSATVTFESPKSLSSSISGYSKYTKTYTVRSSKKETVDIVITGVELIPETNITVKFSEGKTYNLKLSIVEDATECTAGIALNGEQFKLIDGIGVNTSVLERGYIAGFSDYTFRPTNTITREEFGVMLSRILNSSISVRPQDYCIDVKSDWSKEEIAKLSAMGIINGFGYYRPTALITRGEVVEMLYKTLNLSDFSTSCYLSDVDSSEIGQKISRCYNAGIIRGYPNNTFGKNNTITRAEAVAMLNRIFYLSVDSTKHMRFIDVPTTYWAYDQILKAGN